MSESSDTRALILIVEDEEPVRRTARRFLEAGPYDVIEADNGVRGIEMLESHDRVEFVVADIDMPELAGDDMVKRLRARHPHLKVLCLSGHVDRFFEERQFLWEDEAFLENPFTQTGLLEAVSLLLYGPTNPR
jgi:two-component system cell cycle sensor histidine kinase/response regulator CckA